MKNHNLLFPAFLFTFLLFNCNNSQPADSSGDSQNPDQTCIEKIIAEDEKFGKIRNHACENQSLSQTVIDYTTALEGLDFSECPEAFSNAFKGHIEAWRAVIPATDKYPDLRGEMHDVFEIIETGADSTEFKALVAEVWATWGNVEKAMTK